LKMILHVITMDDGGRDHEMSVVSTAGLWY
jgi:hypothetical protein